MLPRGSMRYQFEHRLIRQVGYGVWILFGMLALVFFRERAIFTDAAFQNFHMLQEEAFYIAHGRFGNAIPQLFPWIIMKLGGSLQGIFIAYSLSFILFFAAIYALLVSWLKNDFLGWTLILYFCLLAYDSFFHVQSELYQGIAVLLLTFGLVLKDPAFRRTHTWALLIPLFILLAFYHKLTILFFFFCWVFFWLYNRELRHSRYVIFLAGFILTVVLKSWLWQSGYEDNRMAILRQGLQDYFPNFWDMPANAKFLKKCVQYYYFFPILFFFLLIFYGRNRRWKKLGLIAVSCLGYILLVHYSSPNTTYRFYAEVTYLPLGLLLGLPLVFDVFPKLGSPKKLLLILGLILLSRTTAIVTNGMNYKARLEWLQSTLTQAQAREGGALFRQYSGEMDKDKYITDWALPYESLLLSALETPEAQSTLLVDDDFMELYESLQEPGMFLSRFERIPLSDLNPGFFSLTGDQYFLLE